MLARAARAALPALASMQQAQRCAALAQAAAALRADAAAILEANRQDCAAANAAGLSSAMLDRLRLDPERLEGIAAAVEAVAALPVPLGEVIVARPAPQRAAARTRARADRADRHHLRKPPQRHRRRRRAVPSQGNAVLLRGGSEAARSNRAIHAAFVRGLGAAGVPAAAVQLVPTQDRAAVGAMLGAAGLIDMIVPRGGKRPGRAGPGRRARAGARPPRRHLPHLRPRRRRSGQGGAPSRSTPRCAAPACAGRWRRC